MALASAGERSPQEMPTVRQLLREFLCLYGPVMGGEELRRALGYPSAAAFRQAQVRKTVPVPLFSIEHRRGKFAWTKEVVAWLALQQSPRPGGAG